MAQHIIANEFPEGLRKIDKRLYRFSSGIWTQLDDETLQEVVLHHLGISVTVSQLKNVVTAIGWLGQRVSTLRPSPDYICFRNGTYDVRAGRLIDHSPTLPLRNRIEFDYDPQAQCPRFLQFLEWAFEGDPDKEAKIRLMQEWSGLCLTAGTQFHIMLVLLGDGANGKSVFAELLRRMVGFQNTTTAELYRFRHPYVRAALDGALLNISFDLSRRDLGNEGILKALIAGEATEVSPKNQPSYTIEPYAKFMVCTNHMPVISDNSNAFPRRIRVVRFNRSVPESERDPYLVDRLAEEIPGIIAWAVRGLHRLIDQNYLTQPESSALILQAFRDEVDPVRQFANECLRPSGDRTGYKAKDVFRAFSAWCRDHGYRDCGNVVTLGRTLSALGFSSRKSSTTIYLVQATEEGRAYFGTEVVEGAPQSGEA